jgi:predicted enzyme related to lactoylglutathione lyase
MAQTREGEITMFEHARGVAVIAASDFARARSFYEGVLGLTPEELPTQGEASAIYRWGGIPLMVYETSYAGTAKNTVLALQTDDLAADMAALRGKGVAFMDYDFPGLKTVDGVAELPGERSSWFADSEGNIIALFQRT